MPPHLRSSYGYPDPAERPQRRNAAVLQEEQERLERELAQIAKQRGLLRNTGGFGRSGVQHAQDNKQEQAPRHPAESAPLYSPYIGNNNNANVLTTEEWIRMLKANATARDQPERQRDSQDHSDAGSLYDGTGRKGADSAYSDANSRYYPESWHSQDSEGSGSEASHSTGSSSKQSVRPKKRHLFGRFGRFGRHRKPLDKTTQADVRRKVNSIFSDGKYIWDNYVTKDETLDPTQESIIEDKFSRIGSNARSILETIRTHNGWR